VKNKSVSTANRKVISLANAPKRLIRDQRIVVADREADLDRGVAPTSAEGAVTAVTVIATEIGTPERNAIIAMTETAIGIATGTTAATVIVTGMTVVTATVKEIVALAAVIAAGAIAATADATGGRLAPSRRIVGLDRAPLAITGVTAVTVEVTAAITTSQVAAPAAAAEETVATVAASAAVTTRTVMARKTRAVKMRV